VEREISIFTLRSSEVQHFATSRSLWIRRSCWVWNVHYVQSPYVAASCSELQRVAASCSELQQIAALLLVGLVDCGTWNTHELRLIALRSSELQHFAASSSILPLVAALLLVGHVDRPRSFLVVGFWPCINPFVWCVWIAQNKPMFDLYHYWVSWGRYLLVSNRRVRHPLGSKKPFVRLWNLNHM